MKMAKASEADIDMAMKVANVLDDLERGYFPERFIDLDGDPHNIEIPEHIDFNDHDQYERLITGLKELFHACLRSTFDTHWHSCSFPASLAAESIAADR